MGVSRTDRILRILFLVCLIQSNYAEEEEPDNRFKIIEITSGKIRGKLEYTYLHQKPYYSFRGIPYAKPPLGSLRFKVS